MIRTDDEKKSDSAVRNLLKLEFKHPNKTDFHLLLATNSGKE